MASRHEIVTIDFRANAAKANPAMDSLRQSAKDMRTEIEKTQKLYDEGLKTGMAQSELDALDAKIKSQERTLLSYQNAMATLSKGVGTLARAIDAFNAGTLDKMNAAFQKQAYNAAENAKKLLVPGSEGYEKNMAELDALQQKNLENLAKYKLRTEQLLQSIGEGGKISATDLKTEADGLEELMKLLPHLGNEWQEYYQILLRVRDAIKQQTDEEKRLKGTIVDANDARERSAQLTRQGAENARQQNEAAKKEVDSRTAIIDKLKEEREVKKKDMADTAAILQQKQKEIDNQKKTVEGWEKTIKNEKKDATAREKRIETLKQENETLQTTADTNRKTVEQMKGDLKGLQDELDGVNAKLEKMGKAAPAATAPDTTPTTAVKKEEVQVVNEKAEADKKEEQTVKNKTKAKREETQAVKENTTAKEQEAKADEQVAEGEKKEVLSKKEVQKKIEELKTELDELYEKRDLLLKQQENERIAAEEEGKAADKQAEAIERVAKAYGQLNTEQAKVLLENKQILTTFTKGEDGKFAFTNAEEAQHYILDYVQKLGGKNGKEYSLGGEQVKTFLTQFKERYGMASDEDTVGAIRGLFANGGLIDSGNLNTFIHRLSIKASDSAATYAREIKDLTTYIEKETNATSESNSAREKFIETSNTLSSLEDKIKEKEAQKNEYATLNMKLVNGEIKDTETLTQKTQQLTETQKQRVEAIKAETEAIKKMSKEEAEAASKAEKEKRDNTEVKYKRGKLYSNDIEEVQRWIIGQMKDLGAAGSDGTLKLTGTKVTELVKNFKTKYNAVDKNAPETDLTFAKQLLADVLKSGEGMLAFGDTNLKGSRQSITIEYIKDIFDALIEKNKQLIVAKTGAKRADDEETESIEENTEAAKKNTEAVNGESEAIKKQKELVADLKNKWEESKRKYNEYNDKYNKDIREAKRLKKGSMDEQLAGEELADKAETYKAQYVDTEKAKRENYKKLYNSAQSTLDKMQAQQAQEATTAENQNTEAVERNTGSRRRKKKATEEITDVQKEQNKVEGEAIKQGQQLSAEEQKKQELLKRQNELQGQINEKQTEANRLEEEAAGADTKKANNLKTITDLQNKNVNAHTQNEQALGRENEKLEKLENQQTKNIKKYNEAKDAVLDYDKQIDEHATHRAEANKRAAQTERLTIDAMNDAIKALEEENRAIDPQSAKWMENTRVIRQYKEEIDRLKNQPVLQMMTERMGNIKNLSANALAETKKFWEQMAAGAEHGSHKLAVYEGNLKVIAEEERQRRMEIQKPMRENLNNLGRLSANDLTETKRYWEAVHDGAEAGSAAYKKAELAVKALGNEEKRRKDNDMAQYINDQMRDLNNLSVTGLAEVKRYWEAMANGAKRGSDEAKDAANALRQINTLENDRLKESADRLNGNLGRMSQGDLRQAIEDAKKYQLTLGSTSKEAKELAERIVTAEEHIKRYGVEAEREARRQEEADKRAARAARDKAEADMQAQQEQRTMMMQRSMESQRTKLSAEALTETKKYWEAVARGAEEGSVAQRNALTIMERITAEEKRRNTERNEQLVTRLEGNYANYSEAEMREAIAAGQQLIQTYKVGSEEANELATKIVNAENHVKQYGVEAERQAQQQTKSIDDMKTQLEQGAALSQSALKAQEQYWQRLIDDPKNADKSLDRYRKNLEQVQELQKKVAENDIIDKGKETLKSAKRGDYATASMSALDEAIKKLEAYQALIKDPNGAGAETFKATKEQIDTLSAKLNTLKGIAEKVTGTFASADEVMARWAEHMNGGKTASEGMAQTLDEKLAGATSIFDEDIKQAAEDVDHWNNRIQEETQELAEMEAELEKLEKKHANSSWFRKHTDAYRREAWHIGILRNNIGKPETEDDGTTYMSGKKGDIEMLESAKQRAQENLDYYKKQKAEALGLTEAEVHGEEKKADAKRLTNEQMQQGIKLLEEEYAKTDHTTEEGIKKREQLRDTIDQMNQELKESTGEWIKLADAEKLAEQAGKDTFLNKEGKGFIASPEEIQKATQALERRRDALIKNMKTSGEATKEQERELADLTKKIKDLKFEQDNLNMSQEKMQMLMRTPTNAVSLDELRSAIKRADGELKRMEGSLGANSKEYKAFAEQVKQAKNVLKEMEGQAKATSSAWDKAWSRLKTYVGMYMGFNILWQKITGTFGDIQELSDRMGEVRKTTGFTADEVGRLSDNLAELDTRTGLTNLMSISAKAGQLGLKNMEDVMGFTEAANKLMVALPEMGEEAATQMMKVAIATGEVNKIQKEMDEGVTEGSSATAVALERIGSTIDQLRANSAAAAPQITDFVKRVGAVGAQSNISIDQVAALGSTVDALGMRVEMSATALSRMIPAIKRNAFEVAKAIGMTPNALRQMFDEAGGGMNAMLAIFQHIKDAGMNADDIEKMMGMGGMADIMKDLNQQGARAGIVFAGLSQNVDELRRQLGVAKTAYEENIAIQNEYDKMNETTAAKWERLSNKIEEVFVGDRTQNTLGVIIDGLRTIIDLITGPLSTAFKTTVFAVTAIKTGLTEIPSKIGGFFDYLKESAMKAGEELQKAANATGDIAKAAEGIEGAGDAVSDISEALGDAQEAGEQAGEAMETATGAIEGMTGATRVSIFSVQGLKTAWKGLDATMKTNIIVAVVALLYTLGKALYNALTETSKYSKAVADANAMIQIAIDRFEGYWEKLKETAAALDRAKKSTEGLKEGSDQLTKATIDLTKADNAHKAAIADINSIYGKYLGFMLTEANYANLSAAAHDKVAAAIRREMLAKQQQAAIDQVTQENTEDLKDGLANLTEELREDGRLNNQEAAKAKSAVQKFMRENIKFNTASGEYEVNQQVYQYLTGKGANLDKLKGLNPSQLAAGWFYEYLKENFHLNNEALADITGVFPQGGSYRKTNVGGRNFRGDYASAYLDNMQDVAEVQDVFAGDLGDAQKEDRKATTKLVEKLKKQADAAKAKITDKSTSEKERNAAYEDLANALEGLDDSIEQLNPVENKTLIGAVKKQAEDISKSVDKDKLLRARTNARSIFARATGSENGYTPEVPLTPESNPWGEKLGADSTDWANMTAEQLVQRRKQMKDFVNSIQTDTDVKAVLEEDAALKKAIENGMSADMRTVIEWYNTERLKIQDELHARHLTNTGDWMDPKKTKARKKLLHDETKMFLDELDAYYTERKAKIQEAGIEEGITEAEMKNRTLANEAEWRQRRMELQKMYGDKQEEVTQKEQDAIFNIIAERTEDDVKVVKGMFQKTLDFVEKVSKMGEQGEKEAREFRAKMDKQAMQDLLKEQNAMHQQMKAIQDIIDKERPFNGITKNLRENLVTMGILTADMTEERNRLMAEGADMADFNARQAAEELKRTTFMLGESENAYTTTIEDIMKRMADAGMQAWADELKANPQMREALIAQLHQTYDDIQEAIKKEASLMKKQAENMWNSILLPGGDGKTTIKEAFEKAIAQLGIDQGRVSRANSLIGAGQASERVADKLAIKQMQLQLTMQEHYFNLMRKQGKQRINDLERQIELAKQEHDIEKAKRLEQDKQHAEMSLRLAMTKEQTELLKQQEDIIARTEESQNRLYKELREWGDLLASSVREVMEASNAGNAEYYNELAKYNLTGKGGPGAGTYIVIENEGKEDAEAHYEYLSEREALDRQHQIEQENAQAEAWKKVMDDLNAKMNEQITDMMNAALQNQSIDANTSAVNLNNIALNTNTQAMAGLTGQLAQGITIRKDNTGDTTNDHGLNGLNGLTDNSQQSVMFNEGVTPGVTWTLTDDQLAAEQAQLEKRVNMQLEGAEKVRQANEAAFHKVVKTEGDSDKQMVKSTQSTFAKMTLAANMYGVAYQAMSNENLSTTQKFEMMALQAVGNYAISALTTEMAAAEAKAATDSPGVFGKLWKELGWAATPVFALFTGLLGGLMGLATSKIGKAKSTIAQATGASASAGKLATGMLAYAEGNVNEFTDPGSLKEGRQYNVDAADGRTYRARYMGKGAKTHITNGPEFHLVGEKGREAIIDAGTTRQITLNEPEIWHSIQTLYNGGSLRHSTRHRGVRAFADGNMDEFEMSDGGGMMADGMDLTAMRDSLDRNSAVQEALLERLKEPIVAQNILYGPDGLPAILRKLQKEAERHGEKYL